MMGHHGVKVELQDVDVGWWFPGGFPCFAVVGEKKKLVGAWEDKKGNLT